MARVCAGRLLRGAYLRAAGCALLWAASGCAPARFGAPAEARAALQRINDNFAAVGGVLYGSPAVVSCRFRDEAGVERRFLNQSAVLLFGQPRCLRFEIRSLAGTVAHIGANDERYWVWVDVPERRKLWWGTWAALEAGAARRFSIPPDELLQALLLAPIAEHSSVHLPPLLMIDAAGRWLLFQAYDDAGWPYVRRVMRLDPCPPNLPAEITDYAADGGVVMRADLRSYRRVSNGGPAAPFVARRYVVAWPRDGAELRLDLEDVRYWSKDLPFCGFPETWDGELERLDQTPPVGYAPENGPVRS